MVRGAALAAALCLTALPGGADPLAPGATVSGRGTARHELAARAGDYVEGRVLTPEAPGRVELVAPPRLFEGGRGRVEFRFVAATDRPVLSLALPEGAGYELALDRVVPAADWAAPAPLSPRMAALAAGGDVEAFWAGIAAEGTPMVEPGPDPDTAVVTFLYRGAERGVRLFGGPASDHDELERLAGTDIWHRSYVVPRTARFSYQLAPDVPAIPGTPRDRRVAILATAAADPLNRFPWPADAPDRHAAKSTFALDAAPDQPGTPPSAEARPVIESFDLTSALLGNTRRIVLSRPEGFDPADPAAVLLIVFDGERAIRLMASPEMLDTLHRDGRLPAILAVHVDSLDNATRGKELPGNPAFTAMLTDELLPEVARRTGFAPPRERTALTGASYGGLAALRIAQERPDVFGAAVALSSSLWWDAEGGSDDLGLPGLAAQLLAHPVERLRIFLSAGDQETAHGGVSGIMETSRIMRDMLRLGGHEVHWRAYAAGHDYFVWRGAMADGLMALFGRQDGAGSGGR